MQVTQPNEFYKGLPKEDVFFVKDDQNNHVGEGFLIYQYQPTIFPSRPVNIYFSMTSKPEGEYWLLGSLAARARQLRNQAPGAAARLYTAVDVQDERQLAFYEHNGFKMDYTEDLVRLNDPDEVPQLFNCSCITLPLNTVQEQMDLVSRMRGAGFSYFDHGFLLQQMNRQNFAALGILYGSNLVGACVAAGQYTSGAVHRAGVPAQGLGHAFAPADETGAGEHGRDGFDDAGDERQRAAGALGAAVPCGIGGTHECVPLDADLRGAWRLPSWMASRCTLL